MFATTSVIIEGTLKTGWALTSASAVPIRWRNVPWKQPDTDWISCTITRGDGRQASLGASKLERQLGIVIVQVFTPKNTGTRRAEELADLVGTIFRYQTKISGGVSVIFRAPEMDDVADRVNYYQANVAIPFQAEKFFS